MAENNEMDMTTTRLTETTLLCATYNLLEEIQKKNYVYYNRCRKWKTTETLYKMKNDDDVKKNNHQKTNIKENLCKPTRTTRKNLLDMQKHKNDMNDNVNNQINNNIKEHLQNYTYTTKQCINV
eukprot:2455616-Amphidinium_carterae.4